MIQPLTNSLFSTYDLSLCCALLAVGFSLRELDYSNPSKVGFLFAREGNFDQAVEDYWNDKLLVNPRQYFNILKDLKSRLYSRR